MHWLRAHPFAILFASAGLILLAIAIGINATRIPDSSFRGPSVVAVSGGNTLQDRGISQPVAQAPQDQSAASTREATTSAMSTQPVIRIYEKPTQSTTTPPSATQTSETDYQSILSSISASAESATSTKYDPSATDAVIQQVYALIPSTYSLSLPAPVNRTSSQQSLYAYGNQAGLAVISFENDHTDMADVLKTWFNDRKDSSALASAQTIANDMISTGDALDALPNVPAAAVAANQNLARSYRGAGEELLNVLKGGSDSHLVDSMKTYNASADTFTTSYLALVDLFTKNSVTFSPSDMGNAFSPTGSGL